MDVNSVLQNTRQYFRGIPSSSPATGELAPGASVGYSSPPVSSTATSVASATNYPYAGFPPTSWSSQPTSQNYYPQTPSVSNAQRFSQTTVSTPYHFYENARSQKSLPSTSNSFPQHNYTAPSITRSKEGVSNQGMFNMDSIVCQPNVNYMQGKRPKMKTSVPSSSSMSSINVYKQPTQLEESRFFNSHAPSSQTNTLPVQTLPPRVPSVLSHTSTPPQQLQRPPESNTNHQSYPHSQMIDQRAGFQQQVSYHSSSTLVRAVEKSNSREPVDVRYYINRRIETTALQASPAVKRDSPLDLSVKTIRQSADSTAHDDSENAFNHHNFSVAPHPIRDGRHSHLPQLPFAGNLATAAGSLPNVHNHSNSAFTIAQRPHYPSNSSPGYSPETYRHNGVQDDKIAVRHPVSEYRNEKMTFSFTYEQKQMHHTQVNAQVSSMRYSQYYQQNEHKKAVTQQSLIIERGNTSMNQLLSEKNFAPPNTQKTQSTSRKRKANNEPSAPMKNPRISLEWRENIDKEIENRLNEYTTMKAREEKEKQAAEKTESYRDGYAQISSKELNDTQLQPKLPFTQYLEQHKAQHKLPVQPVQAHPQWFNTQPRTHLSNHQYPTRPEPQRAFQDAHALKFNKTSYEPKDLKIIEKVENMKQEVQEQRPLPPFGAFSVQRNAPAPEERQRKSSTHRLHKIETESPPKKKETEEHQSRAALMASALAHPRIRTKAELKQVIPADKMKDKTAAEIKLPEGQSISKFSRMNYDQDQKPNTKRIDEHHKPLNFVEEKSYESSPIADMGKQFSPRKRSFSRDDTAVTVHRSSSETTVFDFRSDSEPEYTPIDLHSLSNMRKDRKNRTPSVTPTIIDQLKEEQNDDSQWLEACDELIQQFSNGGQKRRGRKKKVNAIDKENEPKKKRKESTDKIIPPEKIKKEAEEEVQVETRKVSDVETKKEPILMDDFDDEDDDDTSDDDEDEDYEPATKIKEEAKESKTNKVNVTLEIRGQRSNVSTTRIRIQNSLEDSSDSDDDNFKEEFVPKKVPIKKPKVLMKKKLPVKAKSKIVTRKKSKNIDPKRDKMRHMILRRMETRKSKMDALKAKKQKNEKPEEPQTMMTRKMVKNQKDECKKRKEEKAIIKEEKTKKSEKDEKKKDDKKAKDKSEIKTKQEEKKSKEKHEEKLKTKVNEKSKLSKEKTSDKVIKKEESEDEKPKPKDKTDTSPRNKLRSGDKLKKLETKPDLKEKEDVTRRSLRSRNVIVSNDKSPKKVKKSEPPKENTKNSLKTKKEPKNEEKKEKPDTKPSWEEELFNYKYSLRMPVKLINIARPSNWPKSNGGASSLPDLDRSETDSDLLNDCSKSSKTPKKKNKDESKVSNTKEFKDSVKFLKEKFDKKIEEKNKATSLTALMMEKKIKIIPKSSDGPELLPTPSLESFKSKLNNKTDTPKKSDSKKSKSNDDNEKEEIVEDSLIGYFRKETVDMFKEVFEKHQVPNQFKTVILESRTRMQTKEMKHNATLKQVFGCDRPASAPPVSDSINEDDKKVKNSNGCLKPWQKSFAKLKLLVEDCQNDKDGVESEDTVDFVFNADDSKDNNEIELENVVKKKTRSIRRKCRSSGFDYIRKKKKQKKEEDDDLNEEREKKKAVAAVRPTPESIEDIQNEIKSWVVNKGIGETVLHKAARLGYLDISSYCLEKLSVSPSPTDNAGYTPLHEACTRGHLKIAKMLLKYGADVSASAKGGIRPLHEAVENGNVELVRLLLSYGADPLLSTYGGQTPLSLVKEEQDDLREFLLLYLADIQGTPSKPWPFIGYDNIDPELCGYDPLKDSPPPPPEEITGLEFEISDQPFLNLYKIKNDPDYWVLYSDLPVKIRDSVTKRDQNGSQYVTKKLSRMEFDENVECASFLESKFLTKNKKGANFTLVKYNDKLLLALNIQTVTMTFS